MKYGIHALEPVGEAFVWKWADLEQAKNEALRLSHKHKVRVIVFEIVGTYHPTVTWEESNAAHEPTAANKHGDTTDERSR
jgi:hypothetical protein